MAISLRKNTTKKTVRFSLLSLLSLFSLPVFSTYNFPQAKASFVPMNDSQMPLRYFYHTLEDSKEEGWDFSGEVQYRYSQNYHRQQLSTLIFGENPLLAGGTASFSGATGDYGIAPIAFPLPQESRSQLCHQLNINNNYIDFSVNVTNGDDWYGTALVTIQRNSSRFCCNETINEGTGTLPKGYSISDEYGDNAPVTNYFVTPQQPSAVLPLNSIAAYLGGAVVKGMETHTYGKIAPCGTVKWGIPGIALQVGWDGFKRSSAHIGFYARAFIPTGTKLDCCWAQNAAGAFVGNGNFCEVGLGMNSHVTLWERNDAMLSVIGDGYFVHGFSATQWRTFDFITGALTRYGNVKQLSGTTTDNNVSTYDYRGLTWGADITTQPISVTIPLKGELLLSLLFEKENSTVELGYNFKGQQGEVAGTTPGINSTKPYFLSCATQVNTPQASGQGGSWTNSYITPHSDMYGVSTQDISLYGTNKMSGIPASPLYTLGAGDIAIDSGLMGAQVLNIIFAGYTYTWNDSCYTPALGIKASFGMSPKAMYTPETWDIGVTFGLDY